MIIDAQPTRKIRRMSPEAYGAFIEAIEQKYMPLIMPYRHMVSGMSSQQIVALRTSKLMHRVHGLECAFEIMRYAGSLKMAVKRLNEQVAEPSIPKCFREAVQLVLDDAMSEVLAPLNIEELNITEERTTMEELIDIDTLEIEGLEDEEEERDEVEDWNEWNVVTGEVK